MLSLDGKTAWLDHASAGDRIRCVGSGYQRTDRTEPMDTAQLGRVCRGCFPEDRTPETDGSMPSWGPEHLRDVLIGSVAVESHSGTRTALPDSPRFPITSVVRDDDSPNQCSKTTRHNATNRHSCHYRVDRTLIECARDLDEASLRQVVEQALRLRLTYPGRVEKRLNQLVAKGRRGSGRLRKILAELNDGEAPTESELESAFRRLCRRAELSPSRQVWVKDTSVIGRVDFAFNEYKVVVELDGRRWHSTKSDIERDRRREARLFAEGWVVLRFTWDQVKNEPQAIVAALRRTLADRAPVIQGVLVPNPQ